MSIIGKMAISCNLYINKLTICSMGMQLSNTSNVPLFVWNYNIHVVWLNKYEHTYTSVADNYMLKARLN